MAGQLATNPQRSSSNITFRIQAKLPQSPTMPHLIEGETDAHRLELRKTREFLRNSALTYHNKSFSGATICKPKKGKDQIPGQTELPDFLSPGLPLQPHPSRDRDWQPPAPRVIRPSKHLLSTSCIAAIQTMASIGTSTRSFLPR